MDEIPIGSKWWRISDNAEHVVLQVDADLVLWAFGGYCARQLLKTEYFRIDTPEPRLMPGEDGLDEPPAWDAGMEVGQRWEVDDYGHGDMIAVTLERKATTIHGGTEWLASRDDEEGHWWIIDRTTRRRLPDAPEAPKPDPYPYWDRAKYPVGSRWTTRCRDSVLVVCEPQRCSLDPNDPTSDVPGVIDGDRGFGWYYSKGWSERLPDDPPAALSSANELALRYEIKTGHVFTSPSLSPYAEQWAAEALNRKPPPRCAPGCTPAEPCRTEGVCPVFKEERMFAGEPWSRCSVEEVKSSGWAKRHPLVMSTSHIDRAWLASGGRYEPSINGLGAHTCGFYRVKHGVRR